jgi:hypothetical protein
MDGDTAAKAPEATSKPGNAIVIAASFIAAVKLARRGWLELPKGSYRDRGIDHPGAQDLLEGAGDVPQAVLVFQNPLRFQPAKWVIPWVRVRQLSVFLTQMIVERPSGILPFRHLHYRYLTQ